MSSAELANAKLDKWGPYELSANPRALFKLARGISVAIATTLIVPDAIAMLPRMVSWQVWCLNLIGMWWYAALIGFCGFLSMLLLVRLSFGGIVLDERGIKLWRFGRLIPWQSVRALTSVQRKTFSKIFLLNPPARQMTLHIGSPDSTKHSAREIPSFQFSPDEFASLFFHIAKMSFAVSPASVDVFLFRSPSDLSLGKMASSGRLRRVVMSILISFSLVVFLFRQGAANYTFNLGTKLLHGNDFEGARRQYELSTIINPFFAPGYERLARAEYGVGDRDSAFDHWQHALSLKPDYVEAKVGLASILLDKGELDKAELLLRQCTKLNPRDPAPYIGIAEICLRRGQKTECIRLLKLVLAADPTRINAKRLLERATMGSSEPEKQSE